MDRFANLAAAAYIYCVIAAVGVFYLVLILVDRLRAVFGLPPINLD